MAKSGFTSNRKAVEAQFERNIAKALTAMGLKADELTKQNIVNSGRIDTGTMLNSVISQADVPNRELLHGGTVFYFIFQELGTSRGIQPMNAIRNTINNGQGEFKAIVEAVMGEGFN
jgi:hypothetical protein